MRQVTDVREWQDRLYAIMCQFGDFCNAHGLRYQLFGGTLLGPGGLVRAYTTATQMAIEQACEQELIVEKTLVVPVEVGIPYAMHDRVRDLAARSGAHVAACDYGADVTLSLVFRAGEQDAFVAAMRELMAGEDVCLVGDAEFDEF